MKTLFKTDDKSVAAMIRSVLRAESASRDGATNYLRTLIAAVQKALGSNVRIAPQGRVRAVTGEDALSALNAEHSRFYAIVLAELPGDLDSRERNARSGFARSAVSTVRSAIKAGLNPLEIVVPAVTKEALRQYTRTHATASTVDASAAQNAAKFLVRRIGKLLEGLNDEDKADVVEFVHAELEAVETRAGVKVKPPAPPTEQRRRASDFASGGQSSH